MPRGGALPPLCVLGGICESVAALLRVCAAAGTDAVPGMLQGLTLRLTNSERRNNDLRAEIASLQAQLKSYEEEAVVLRDHRVAMRAQLKAFHREAERFRMEAGRNDRAARELHALLVGPLGPRLFHRPLSYDAVPFHAPFGSPEPGVHSTLNHSGCGLAHNSVPHPHPRPSPHPLLLPSSLFVCHCLGSRPPTLTCAVAGSSPSLLPFPFLSQSSFLFASPTSITPATLPHGDPPRPGPR